MHRNKLFYLFTILTILIQSCIDEYKPDIDNKDINKYVIYGKITNTDANQFIYISKSTQVLKPEKVPGTDCDVKIIDDSGNIFQLNEIEDGCYTVSIEPQYLTYGSSFKINVLTPDGDLISSEFEELRTGSNIDSIYYEITETQTSDPGVNIPTLQFYLDYTGNDTDNRLYKIEIEETWEYHSDFPLKWYYNGRVHELAEADYSRQICWQTKKASQIYVLSTEGFSQNQFLKYPLHSIPNTSGRLAHGYSLLIKQSSISKPVYEYFKKINANIVKEGGLYDTQPQQIEGNLINTNNPDQKVLGYFYVSGEDQKRIFIEPLDDFPLNYSTHCDPIALDLGPYVLGNKFVYLWYYEGSGKAYMLVDHCVDCTALGGSTIKPDFWPN